MFLSIICTTFVATVALLSLLLLLLLLISSIIIPAGSDIETTSHQRCKDVDASLY